jgi:predicted SPOUT superfamily RNA methylase MTH1
VHEAATLILNCPAPQLIYTFIPFLCPKYEDYMSVNRGKTLVSLLIPASFTEESPDPRVRTYKVGQIARAASVFRVDEIVIYHTKGFDDSRFMSTVLRYAETPQYLRKALFPMQDALRYAGIIPPLRIPSHTVNEESEYREGIVTNVGSDQSVWVDVGTADSPVCLGKVASRRLTKGERISVRICSRSKNAPVGAGKLQLVNKRDIPAYWGYEVRNKSSLHESLTEADGLRIATSRQGNVLDCAMLSEIGKETSTRDKVSVAFGSPSKGVDAILSDEGHKLEDHSNYVVNAVPNQGASTVRTEEAVFITMGLLNLAW